MIERLKNTFKGLSAVTKISLLFLGLLRATKHIYWNTIVKELPTMNIVDLQNELKKYEVYNPEIDYVGSESAGFKMPQDIGNAIFRKDFPLLFDIFNRRGWGHDPDYIIIQIELYRMFEKNNRVITPEMKKYFYTKSQTSDNRWFLYPVVFDIYNAWKTSKDVV